MGARAAKQNVEAETRSQTGRISEALKTVAQDEDVTLIVLGHPSGEESFFDEESLQEFAAEIEAETTVETRII